jgi:hypothetical protein
LLVIRRSVIVIISIGVVPNVKWRDVVNCHTRIGNIVVGKVELVFLSFDTDKEINLPLSSLASLPLISTLLSLPSLPSLLLFRLLFISISIYLLFPLEIISNIAKTSSGEHFHLSFSSLVEMNVYSSS